MLIPSPKMPMALISFLAAVRKWIHTTNHLPKEEVSAFGDLYSGFSWCKELINSKHERGL